MTRLRVMLLASLLAAPAQARPRDGRAAEALRHFEAGTVLYAQGRFEDALAEFRKAHDIKPDPVLLFDLAQTCRALGRDDEALEYYRAYVRAAPYAPNRDETLGKIRVLEQETARRKSEAAEAEAARRTAAILDLQARSLLEQAEDARLAAREAQARADRLSRNSQPVHKRWWFWTVTGLLVAGGITTGVVLGLPSPPSTEQGNIRF